jgi:hypothetical protein
MVRFAPVRRIHLTHAEPMGFLRSLMTPLLLLLLLSPTPVRADGVFVPAALRVDMVHDLARNILYITNGASILRYDVANNTLLTSFTIPSPSAHLMGIDLSPDGSTLVAADSQYSPTNNWVWIVDLTTGAIRQQLFPLAFYEAGTFAVAFGNDGKCLVSSNFAGSGWVPLRRLDPATGVYSTIATIDQASMLSASGDGSVIGVAESNSSDGPVARYRVADGNWLERTGYTYGTSWFNFEIAVNHDGTQYSVPTYDGTFIHDGNLLKTGQMVGGYATAGQPIGAAYHPVQNTVYYAWAGTPNVYAYDATTLTRIASYNAGYTFQWTGNSAFYNGRLRISRDGSLLFTTVGDPYYSNSPALGVRILRLYTSLTADNKSVTTNEDAAAPITLSGSVGNGGTIGFTVFSQPAHGTLTGAAPNLTYTPAPDYNGPDSFTYAATYDGAHSPPATVSITVNPVNDAPSFTAGPNQTVNEDSGPYTVSSWATNISPGPANESGQAVGFLVSNDNTGLFSAQPAISSSGTLTFTPAPHAYGTAMVTVRAQDNGGTANGGVDTSASQTFTITVNFVNRPPIAVNDQASTRKGEPVSISVLANDSDPDGDALKVVSVTQGAAGSVAIDANGTVTYTPGKRANSSDTFNYTIQDTHGATATAKVTVTFTNGKPGGKGPG